MSSPSSGQAQQSTEAVPQWFYDHRPNTPVFLYATGEGTSVDAAMHNALNSMSSSIVVTVSGEMERTTRVQGEAYTSNVVDNVRVELSRISFPNPKIKKQEHVNNRFYVLVRVSRSELFNTIKSEFENSHDTVVENRQSASSMGKLDSIYQLRQTMDDVESARANATILASLDSEFDNSQYLRTYRELEQDLLEQQRSLNIEVVGQNSSFNEAVGSFLSAQGFRMSAQNPDVTVEVQTNIRMSEARGWEIARATTHLQILSNSRVLNSLTIDTVGRSSSSADNAVSDAANALEKELNDRGVEQVLFQ